MTILPIVCSTLMFAVAYQDVTIQLPNGPTPTYAIARASQGGKTIAVTRRISAPKTEQRTATRTVVSTIVENGKPKRTTKLVPYTYNVTVMVTTEKKLVHKAEEIQFRDLDGNNVPDDEAVKRLQKKTGVVILRRNQKLDPFYKTIMKKDVLVLSVPTPPRPVVPAQPAMQLRPAARVAAPKAPAKEAPAKKKSAPAKPKGA